MNLRILSSKDIKASLPMPLVIEQMKQAFLQFSSNQADVPLRSRINVPEHNGISLFMPAHLQKTNDLAVKIVSVFSDNPLRDLPTIHALVVVIDPRTGVPLAIMEGATLTAMRTGAASGAATDILARRDAATVAIFGSGTQARTQLEAVCCVREIKHASVYDPDRKSAERFSDEMSGTGSIPLDLEISNSPEEAIERADIICAATTSSVPVFPGQMVKPGTHINAIGSFTPDMQELDADLLQRSLIVVDSRQAVLAESGDLIVPIRRGLLDEASIHAELGEIFAGTASGRMSDDQITVFKSVGLAVQDAIAASAALSSAEEAGLGELVAL